MKRIPILLLLLTLLGCSDGDLQIETLDFDSVSIELCEESATLDTEIFFKRNGSEALILSLQSDLLKNEASTETITSTIPGQSQLTYRVFNENITSDYFCADFPPASPVVVEEIEADAGQVLVTTVAVDETNFQHTIQLLDINLTNENGERITDLSINEFGEITTTISN